MKSKSKNDIRYGEVTVKARETDPVFQTFSVRESDGDLEYYHPQFSDWYSLPSEWAEKIKWD